MRPLVKKNVFIPGSSTKIFAFERYIGEISETKSIESRPRAREFVNFAAE